MTTATSALASAGLPRPLEGIRVLDLTVALAGPFCTLLLAGLGAEVIKVESRKGSDLARTNPPFYGPEGFHYGAMRPGDLSVSTLLRARNKKTVTLDLKSKRGLAIVQKLVAKCDVLAENMSDGVVDRLGLGYDAMRSINPGLVYGSISGMGDPSPLPGLKAMDIIVQAYSGVMDATGMADGPPTRVGFALADVVAPLFALNGIMAALIQRGRTGLGQHVKVSMLDCLAALIAVEHFDLYTPPGAPARTGNKMSRLTPFGLYQTVDGYVAIAAVSDEWFWNLMAAMGRADLRGDKRFEGRGARAVNAAEVDAMIEAWTRTLPSKAVTEALLTKRGVPCAPMRTVQEVLNDQVLRASGIIRKLVHPAYGEVEALGPGLPISFSAANADFDEPAKELGADNRAVFCGLLGMSDAELADLEAQAVI